jgi:hypothetical protein
MDTTKTKIEDMLPLMDRIERELAACSSLLFLAGRLEMVNSVLTPTTTYATCTRSHR